MFDIAFSVLIGIVVLVVTIIADREQWKAEQKHRLENQPK